MKTLYEIVQEVKQNKKPDYDDIRYALLAYVSMFNIEHSQLRRELSRTSPISEFSRATALSNSFDMYKGALERHPKEWLGWSSDPENPEYAKMFE